jgi:outer membrane protein assembly factor BamB
MPPFLLLTLVFGAWSANTAAADWPQWRGPGRNSFWAEKTLPASLPEKLAVRWKQPIGGGYGGIAVAAGRLYVMDRQKRPREVERTLCLDARTGKTLWTHEQVVSYGKLDYGNGPRCTPTVHAGKVYTLGALGHLHCLEGRSGKVLWQGEHVTPRDRNPQASLVGVSSDRALILTTPGELHLVELTPKGLKKLGKAPVIGKTWAHPAFAAGCAFARNDEEIVCVSLLGK